MRLCNVFFCYLPGGGVCPSPTPPSGPLVVMRFFLWLSLVPWALVLPCQGRLLAAKGSPQRLLGRLWGVLGHLLGSLGQPWGGPGATWGGPGPDHGAAWGIRPENEGGQSGFPAQKSTRFWSPRAPNFDHFRYEFSYRVLSSF